MSARDRMLNRLKKEDINLPGFEGLQVHELSARARLEFEQAVKHLEDKDLDQMAVFIVFTLYEGGQRVFNSDDADAVLDSWSPEDIFEVFKRAAKINALDIGEVEKN